MQLEQNQINEVVSINANKIISKYRNKKDRMMFCHEKNWWHPDEPGFDSTFFLQVIAGTKKYLPGNFCIKHKLGYFRSGARLDKKYIIEKMTGNINYGDYVPDNCNPIKLSKEFLLTLVAFVDPQLYKSFYISYKEEIQKRSYNKWSDYNLAINKNIINDINSFIPANDNGKNKGGFQLFKNHKFTNLFTRNNNNNQYHNRVEGQQINIESQDNMDLNNRDIVMDLEQKKISTSKNIKIKLSKDKYNKQD